MINLMSETRVTPQKLLDWLDVELTERNLSDAEASRRAGLSHAAIYEIRSGIRPGIKKCKALAGLFGVPAEYVLRLAGHIDAPPGFDGMRPDFKETFYRLNEIWEAVARKDKTGEGIRELLTMQITNADAFLAVISAMERQQDEERRESKADSGT